MKKSLILFISVFLFFTACKNNKQEIVLSKTQLLTQDIWYLNKVEEYKNNTLESTNEIHGYSFKFNTDNTCEYTEHYDSNPNVSVNTWQFIENETKIELNAGTDKSSILIIEELSEDSFIYTVAGDETGTSDKCFFSHKDN